MKANESNLNGKRLTVHVSQITREREEYDFKHWVVTYTIPFTYEGQTSEMCIRYDSIPGESPDGMDLELGSSVEYSFFSDVPTRPSKRSIARMVIQYEREIARLIEK